MSSSKLIAPITLDAFSAITTRAWRLSTPSA